MPEAVEAVTSVVLLLVGFILVLIMAYGVTRLAGKRFEMGAKGAGYIKVLDRVAIGPDRMLCIVQVADKTLLIGVTPHCIENLIELDPASLPVLSTSADGGQFQDILKNILRKPDNTSGEKEAKK